MNANLRTSLVLALCLAFLPSLASARITDNAEVLAGRIVLTRASQLNVVVMVDNLPAGGDGIADQAFVYRSKLALPAELRDFSGAGRVVVRPDSITIAMAEGAAVSLGVRTEAGREPINPDHLVKSAGAIRTDVGYQLTRLYGRKGVDLVAAAFGQLQPHQGKSIFFDEAEEDSGCTAGGPGSTDCSIQGNIGPGGAGCSVSCASGYYACCSLSGCGCTRAAEL